MKNNVSLRQTQVPLWENDMQTEQEPGRQEGGTSVEWGQQEKP
jgi:hypothetical protein